MGPNWNRKNTPWQLLNYTYVCAVEEMPALYGDTLMACSPLWSFPVVLLPGIAASILTANLAAGIFKLKEQIP